jgi:hypothetical protein
MSIPVSALSDLAEERLGHLLNSLAPTHELSLIGLVFRRTIPPR